MPVPNHKNRVCMSVSGTPGTGTITLNAAESGYQSFATAYGANANVDVLIVEGSAWEVARDCTYTHSGTTLSRGTLEDSSTGSALSLTSAAKVYVTHTASRSGRSQLLNQAIIPGGRLTLESGVPVSTTDQTSKTTVYYTPYIHNIIILWDGADWVPTVFAETSIALGTVTANLPYDVFAYLSGGALALEKVAWASASARATAVSLQDGRYCKTGDKTRLLLGTIAPNTTTQIADSIAHRGVGNLYNQISKRARYYADASNHTYTADASSREYNGTSGVAIVRICIPFQQACVSSVMGSLGLSAWGAGGCAVTVGLNSSTSPVSGAPAAWAGTLTATSMNGVSGVSMIDVPEGLNTLYLLDRNTSTADLSADYGTLNVMALL